MSELLDEVKKRALAHATVSYRGFLPGRRSCDVSITHFVLTNFSLINRGCKLYSVIYVHRLLVDAGLPIKLSTFRNVISQCRRKLSHPSENKIDLALSAATSKLQVKPHIEVTTKSTVAESFKSAQEKALSFQKNSFFNRKKS